MLQCDGFNQCGDNSDEPETCPTQWANSIVDRRWYSHTPNYYFPKVNRFPDVRVSTLALVVSSISLLMVISCLISTLYRNGNRVREREALQNQLHTISQLLGKSRLKFCWTLISWCQFCRFQQQLATWWTKRAATNLRGATKLRWNHQSWNGPANGQCKAWKAFWSKESPSSCPKLRSRCFISKWIVGRDTWRQRSAIHKLCGWFALLPWTKWRISTICPHARSVLQSEIPPRVIKLRLT